MKKKYYLFTLRVSFKNTGGSYLFTSPPKSETYMTLVSDCHPLETEASTNFMGSTETSLVFMQEITKAHYESALEIQNTNRQKLDKKS